MLVRARAIDYSQAPTLVGRFLGQSLISAGMEYDVHAMAVFEGVVFLQVVDDVGIPGWKPGWLFDVVESAMPADWIVSTFPDEPSLVVGPSFVASSLERYQAMVELAPKQVALFWRRIRQRYEDDVVG